MRQIHCYDIRDFMQDAVGSLLDDIEANAMYMRDSEDKDEIARLFDKIQDVIAEIKERF